MPLLAWQTVMDLFAKGYWQSILFTLASSALLTRVEPVRRSLVFLSLLRRRWDLFAWKRFTLPEPVSLKRFFALLWVFIFGMACRFFIEKDCKDKHQSLISKMLGKDYFFFFGEIMTVILRPSSFGSDSATP